MKRFIAAISAALMLTACGGQSNSYETIDDAMVGIGCESGQIDDDPNTFFVAAEGYCEDGRQVNLFNTTESKENFIDFAREFGFEPIEVGDNYLVYDERV